MLGDPQLACWLLFPGATAADLATIQGKQEFDDQSKDKTPVVFVLDGSWPCARKLLRLNPQLADLPHVSFSSAKVSQYRFRRQPHKHCVSTIEAVAEVIALVDQRPNEGVETPESGDDLNRGHSSQGPRILRSLLEELTRVQEQYPKRERI
jgi:DTW domain-containing protein YfiP